MPASRSAAATQPPMIHSRGLGLSSSGSKCCGAGVCVGGGSGPNGRSLKRGPAGLGGGKGGGDAPNKSVPRSKRNINGSKRLAAPNERSLLHIGEHLRAFR